MRVNSYARIEESIIFEGVDIGRHAIVRRAIIDKDVRVPAWAVVGVDPEEDLARGLTVSAAGVTVVPKGFEFEMASARPALRQARLH